ncbi:MAG: dihydroorotate dehydrogenase [Eubacteriales bacterium]
MVDLSVNLSGLELSNPIIPASGTFGYGREYAELFDISVLGSFSIKGTTGDARFGNPTPRIAEAPAGMLNAVGLQNPGIDYVLAEEMPNITKIFGKPVVANIGGFSLEEYTNNCRKFDTCENAGILEVNISCPNLHAGGTNFGSSAKTAAEVTKAVRAVTNKPIYMKLSPNVTDIAEIAKACEGEGADGISLINTLLGMRIHLQKRAPIIANRTGGLSGPAIFPVAVRMVYDVYKAVKLPIIGMGGISSAEDVAEMMLAGATAVEVGAANLKNPYICNEIIENLPVLCEKLGVTKLSELTGGAHQ